MKSGTTGCAASVNMCGNRVYQGTMPMPLIGMLIRDGPDDLPYAQARDRRCAWSGRGAPGRQPTAGVEGGWGWGWEGRLKHDDRRLHTERGGPRQNSVGMPRYPAAAGAAKGAAAILGRCVADATSGCHGSSYEYLS